MTLHALIFYLFSTITLFGAVMVIASKNPVHSVLFLILTFFNAAGLFLLLHAEFIAMVLVIVYVGAVAVLFLFVVMMLNINIAEIKQGFLRYLPIAVLLGVVLMAELILVFGAFQITDVATSNTEMPLKNFDIMTNTHIIGSVLYTDYFMHFQIAGMILLLAMVGAIILTLRHRPGVRRQKIHEQNNRDPNETLVVVKNVPKGGGI